MVGVAQLARALGCGPRGRGFEPRRPPQNVRLGIGALSLLAAVAISLAVSAPATALTLDEELRACLLVTIGTSKTSAIVKAVSLTSAQKSAVRTCTPTEKKRLANSEASPNVARVATTLGMSEIEASIALELFRRINIERRALGLRELVWDSRIAASSVRWSQEMSRSGYAHDPAFPKSMTQPLNSDTWAMAENVHFPLFGNQQKCTGVAQPPDAACAHIGLMNSSSHRRNIVSPLLLRVGIGVYCVASRGVLITERFATLRDDISYGRLLQLKRDDARVPALAPTAIEPSSARCDQ